MNDGGRIDNLESEPFLVDQHENDIELARAGVRSVNGSENENGNGYNKTTYQSGRAAIPWQLGGGSRHNSNNWICGRRMWSPLSRWMSKSVANHQGKQPKRDRRPVQRYCLGTCRVFGYFLMSLGALQCLTLAVGMVSAFFPDKISRMYRSGNDRDRASHWPTDFTADILPVKCHSHNDYWRKVPVFSALEAGCTGIEADVWLYDNDLFVGHARSALTPTRTFTSLYVKPLADLLHKQNPTTRFQPVARTPRNGVFDTNADQTLVLLIDFKTDGDELWSVVRDQLEPLRSGAFLTHFNGSTLIPGPLTIVVTGNAPFHQVVSNTTYRDMFFDAPLREMAQLASNPPGSPLYDPAKEKAYLAQVAQASDRPATSNNNKGQGYSGIQPSSPDIYTVFNSYYASTSLEATIGRPFPYLSASQRDLMQRQIDGAHVQGLQVRYWGVPAWPVSWRHYLWRELMRLGIDYLNVDDLRDASKGEWLSRGIGRLIWGSGGW